MAYGNLNPGVIFVRCRDSSDVTPVKGARAVLTWLQSDAGQPRMRMYDEKGVSTDAPFAEAAGSGVAVLKFLWEPAELGSLVSDAPIVHVSAIGPAPHYSGIFSSTRDNKNYNTTRVGNERVYNCVNFGQAWSGGKGAFQFNSTESRAMDTLSNVKDIIEWSWKFEDAWIKARASGPLPPFLPNIGGFINPRPSIEQFALVGGFDILMDAS
jgi:hypothetical protein